MSPAVCVCTMHGVSQRVSTSAQLCDAGTDFYGTFQEDQSGFPEDIIQCKIQSSNKVTMHDILCSL